jgi:uncharacterized coiled-coil DUF342 family protein
MSLKDELTVEQERAVRLALKCASLTTQLRNMGEKVDQLTRQVKELTREVEHWRAQAHEDHP